MKCPMYVCLFFSAASRHEIRLSTQWQFVPIWNKELWYDWHQNKYPSEAIFRKFRKTKTKPRVSNKPIPSSPSWWRKKMCMHLTYKFWASCKILCKPKNGLLPLRLIKVVNFPLPQGMGYKRCSNFHINSQ